MAFEMHVSQLISKSVYWLHSVYLDCRLLNHVSAKKLEVETYVIVAGQH